MLDKYLIYFRFDQMQIKTDFDALFFLTSCCFNVDEGSNQVLVW